MVIYYLKLNSKLYFLILGLTMTEKCIMFFAPADPKSVELYYSLSKIHQSVVLELLEMLKRNQLSICT